MNWSPEPPAPPGPKPPPPPPPPPPQPQFSFAKVVSNDMVLAAAPKQAMVWGFVPPSASDHAGAAGTVTVQLDGGKDIVATVS